MRVGRLDAGRKAVVVMDGRKYGDYENVFLFKPPFGPYPPELTETFPIGQSEVPPADYDMFRTGCLGLRVLVESNPDTDFEFSCTQDMKSVVDEVLEGLEGRYTYV